MIDTLVDMFGKLDSIWLSFGDHFVITVIALSVVRLIFFISSLWK